MRCQFSKHPPTVYKVAHQSLENISVMMESRSSLNLAGQMLVILTSAEHVADMYKNTADLSFDGLLKMIHWGVANVSPQGFQTLWRTSEEGFESLYPNPKKRVLVYIGNALLHKQVLSGAPLEELTKRFRQSRRKDDSVGTLLPQKRACHRARRH